MVVNVMNVMSVVLGVFLVSSGHGAPAQADYPNKPIRLLVGFAPGGTTDIVARIVGPRLSEALNQQRVVIDNRAGASQVIASELTAKAAPDGYTLFMALAAFAINPAIHKKLPFDLSGVLFGMLARIDIPHVQYKGSGQVMTDLLGGQIHMSFPALSGVLTHIKAGKLTALGVTSRQRSPSLVVFCSLFTFKSTINLLHRSSCLQKHH